MRRAMLVMLLLGGCGGSMVVYDPVRGESKIHEQIVSGLDERDPRPRVAIMFTGKGVKPSVWHCTFFVDVPPPKRPDGDLGEEATLSFLSPDSSMTQRAYVGQDGSILFHPSLDDLAWLVDERRFFLDGKPIALTREEVGKVREMVVAARESMAEK